MKHLQCVQEVVTARNVTDTDSGWQCFCVLKIFGFVVIAVFVDPKCEWFPEAILRVSATSTKTGWNSWHLLTVLCCLQ